jgi:hypothetical protein
MRQLPTTDPAAFAQAAQATLEALAFAMPVDDAEAPAPSGQCVCGQVTFSGPFGGKLWAMADRSVLPALAANMLAVDEPTWEQQVDAFRESLNVLCGNALPVLAGEREVFHVGDPQLADPDAAPPGEPAAQAELKLDIGWVKLRLYLDD